MFYKMNSLCVRLTAALLFAANVNIGNAATESYFEADLRRANVSPAPIGTTPSNVSGKATFTLVEPDFGETGEPELTYTIDLFNVDTYLYRTAAVPETASSADDLLHIHVHNVPLGANTIGTPHVLNVLGAPLPLVGDDREDDLVIESYDPTTIRTRITGRWDSADVLQTAGLAMEGPKTKPLADFLTQLREAQLFMMVHTVGDGTGAIGGTLLAVPEPGSIALAAVALVSFVARRRR